VRDASIVACAVQALLGFYLGGLLRRGATTGSRRTLARVLLAVGAYASLLAITLAFPVGPTGSLLNAGALAAASLGVFDLLAFALWYARGADVAETPRLPRAARLGSGVAVAAAFAGQIAVVRLEARSVIPRIVLLALLLGTTIATLAAFALAWRRGVKGARSYLFATLWPFWPIALDLLMWRGLPFPRPAYYLLRDLCVLAFEGSLLTSYLDDGHEPMTLRDRIVAGVLVTVLSMATAVGHLLFPLLLEAPPGASFPEAHAGTIRLVGIAGVASSVVAIVVRRLYKDNILLPIERLTGGLARAASGERVALPVERRDELGGAARSFNVMVTALAEGRASIEEKVRALERQKAEIAALNEELRRQVAARSRQLADALRMAPGPADAIAPGVVLDGRYRVEGLLGAGGMGRVYAATRLHDGADLALKVIASASPDDAVRFMHEAELAATLAHDNLVSVTDVGMHLGTPYFLMERLHGGSLAEKTDRFGDAAFLLPILRQVARGLRELHARGVLHRDLKPANVLLTGDAACPVAKIGDFGIASGSLVGELAATIPASDLSGQRTAPGQVMGTLPYIAPELAGGPGVYGPPSDVFGFGVLAWEVLSGSLPFAVPPVLTAMAKGVVPPPRTDALRVPEEVCRLLLSCLSVLPEARPALADVVRALETAGEDGRDCDGRAAARGPRVPAAR
jgi:serine/threonine-protein kinase